MIFKKNKALYYDKMNCLKEVTVTEEAVKLHLNWSAIDLKPEDIPGLLADVVQIYAHIKPTLDRKSAEKIEEAKQHNKSNDDKIDEVVDLADIPF